MRKQGARLGLTMLLGLGLLAWPGCVGMSGGNGNGNGNGSGNGNGNGSGNGNGNGNGNDNGSPGAFNFVLSPVPIHVQGRIEVGDDIIAYTDVDADRTPLAPNYIVPSAGDTTGRGIPNATDYDSDSFKATGRKIILTDNNFAVTVFDTTDNSLALVPNDQVRLTNIPVGNYSPGLFEVDGNFVVTRNDTDDDIIVKVIDITNATPQVINFPVNPTNASPFSVQMVAVDAETRTAVAATSSIFAVYDIDNPNNAPTEFDMTAFDGIDDIPIAYDNGLILYVDNSSDSIVRILDTSTAGNTPQSVMTPNRGTSRLILRGNNYGFLYQGPASQGLTAAIGVFPDLNPNTSDGETVFNNSANGGRFGYGDTLAVAANGSTTWFLGGIDDIGLDPFQSSPNGSSWSVTPDPRSPDDNLAVGDVVTNTGGSILSFKHEVDDDQFVGYVILN